MEAENSNPNPNPSSANSLPNVSHRFFPFVVPAILISIGYVDPGKWVATVEGGARFGCDLVVLMFVFNFAAILCQYLSARIGVVTGKDLAQICSEEYDKWTCMALGIQAELSVILLDLTMVLGIAHGLNHLFEWDLFTCVFLTAINAVLFPLFSTLMEDCRVKLLSIYIAGFVLASSILGVLINHPEMTLSMNGMLTKLNGESAFTVMSLLGATIMPHNFYLHSSIVKNQHEPANISKDALFHSHFLAILCVFSGVFVLNYVLLSSAASAFYSSGLVLLTFQDAMSLVEQVVKGPIAAIAFISVLFVSNQITVLNWGIGGQVVLQDFLKLDIPGWLHCATLRIISIIPALYCVWSSGAEGVYELLVLTQVLVALLLPASVIPLFRIAASRQIMRAHKISQAVEFLTLITFIGMLGLKIAFVVEMVFGESDWVGNLWAVGSNASASYMVLLIIVSASFCLMLWLAATPLKSASLSLDSQAWNWDSPKSQPDPVFKKEEIENITKETPILNIKQESIPVIEPKKPSDSDQSDITIDDGFDFGLPESILEPEPDLKATTIEEASPDNNINRSIVEPEKTVNFELDLQQAEKDDEEGESWEVEEFSKGFQGSAPVSIAPEGPGSFRSLSGKSDDGGNGAGSLSRLAGLGRAARRQLAAVLDEFWGQLFDFHGQPTHEARTKKLDLLFGSELKPIVTTTTITTTTTTTNASAPELPSYFSSSLSSLYDSRPQSNLDPLPSFGIQRGQSALWSNNNNQQQQQMQILDAGERRYSSVRNLPSSDSWGGDYQPATVHGYQIASYLKKNSEISNSNSNNSISNYRDSLAYAMSHRPQNGLGLGLNSMTQNDRPYYANCQTSSTAVVSPVITTNTKKYHSSPNIHRDVVPQWAPLAFDELSPSKAYQSALSTQMNTSFNSGSLWSRQPFEQFGPHEARVVGPTKTMMSSSSSAADVEAKLLQSFRHCVVKLLKLEGSDWLFRQSDGADEELIDRVAAREKFLCEAEAQFSGSSPPERKYSSLRSGELVGGFSSAVYSVPHCGEGCVWKSDLVVSFGVWCIHRVLDLSLMESRPELWGKYTYVLNRLQGIIEAAFSKPRTPSLPCFCLHVPPSATTTTTTSASQQRLSPPAANGMMLPPPPSAANKPSSKGKCTTAPMVLDMIKDVEIAISCRKGRTGTAAGDVAFPKGKENLASVLKRYKRRLANKPVVVGGQK